MSGDLLFLVSSGIAFIFAVLYYRSENRSMRLEQQLGEKLVEEYERSNRAEVDERFNRLSDVEQFSEAIRRGISEVPELPGTKGDKQ